MRSALVIAAACQVVLLPGSAQAQVSSLQTGPAEDFALPEPELAAPSAQERILPPITPWAEPGRLRGGAGVRIEALRFE